jgi:hypothetical protein
LKKGQNATRKEYNIVIKITGMRTAAGCSSEKCIHAEQRGHRRIVSKVTDKLDDLFDIAHALLK